jgi:ornithine decarboxylase
MALLIGFDWVNEIRNRMSDKKTVMQLRIDAETIFNLVGKAMDNNVASRGVSTLIEDRSSLLGSLASEGVSVARKLEFEKDEGDAPILHMNLDRVMERVNLWRSLIPAIPIFYAVKCNPDPVLIKTLALLDCNFDCATPNEIELVRSASKTAKLIYSHPCKPVSHLIQAAALGVDLTVFDNLSELEKIKQHTPSMRLLIRIAPIDDHCNSSPMSIKFGTPLPKVKGLLEAAKSMNLNVVGVHFHVGSGCTDPKNYRDALLKTKEVFEIGATTGFDFKLLDIGGGFPGDDTGVRFRDIANEINPLLPQLFKGVELMAEPGRFIAKQSCDLVTKVISKCELPSGKMRYHLNDGVYGSFNCIFFDHYQAKNFKILKDSAVTETKDCCMFGPTCDGIDQIVDSLKIPELNVGDAILWYDMGAYTSTAATKFNGFDLPQIKYYLP